MCNNTNLTFNNFSDKLYISPTAFTSITTGSGSSVEQQNANWELGDSMMGKRKLLVGGGSYACGRSPCEFNYSITGPGGTAASETVFCPSELGTPAPLNSTSVYSSLSSDTNMEMNFSLASGNVSCKAYYEKTSANYTVPTLPTETTWLKFDAVGVNESITMGRDRNYTAASGTFTTMVGGNNAVTIDFDHITSSVDARLIFKAPSNAPLATGTYTNATPFPNSNGPRN